MTVRAVSSNPTSPFYNANAPTLTGQVGSLTAVLDAVLVNGFTGFTALGWSIPQTTTNKRGYKQNLTGSNNTSGMLLYVDDTGPGAGAAKEARVCGFETMSAITPTGTGQFPTGAQSTIGTGQLVIRKSATADATVRNYTIWGNGQTFYMTIESGDSTAPLACTTFSFGDFHSFKANDQFAVMIMGRQLENNASSGADPMHCSSTVNGNSTVNATANVPTACSLYGHYVARSWTGSGGSVRFGKPIAHSLASVGIQNAIVTGSYNNESNTSAPNGVSMCMGRNSSSFQFPSPNGVDGSIILDRVWVGHNFSMRGYLYGIWAPLHDRPMGHNDTSTLSGGNLSGKSILAQSIQAFIGSSATESAIVIGETSDTWA